MKQKFFLLSLCILAATNALAGTVQGTYRIQLFFGDSKPFEDEMTIEGTKGTMHVPNDFDGPLENISATESSFEFDLLVPKNSSRPEMVFHYKAFVHQPGAQNLAGFVTLTKSDGVIVAEPSYIGSFVAFQKK